MGVQTLKRKLDTKPLPVVMAGSEKPPVNGQLMTLAQVAEYCNIPLAAFYNLRSRGMGPKAICLGRRTLRWRLSDVQAWIAAHESVVPA